MGNLNLTLECFCLLSGMKTDKAKCSMVGKVREIQNWSDWLMGCIGPGPLKYLCSSLGDNPSSTSFWNPVFERMDKRLE